MALTEPPFNLHQRPLYLVHSPVRLVRISHRRHPDPIHWSRQGRYRFDDPAAPWGVCYTSEDFETALIEVFGDRWIEGPGLPRAVNLQDLRGYEVCELEASAPFVVVNLTGEGLSRAGTDANLCASTDYVLTRRWALAFMRHPQAPRGLAYPSRHNPAKVNYALFGDRDAEPRLRVVKREPLPDHPGLYRLLDHYDVAGV